LEEKEEEDVKEKNVEEVKEEAEEEAEESIFILVSVGLYVK
jgi:hypothetical protein